MKCASMSKKHTQHHSQFTALINVHIITAKHRNKQIHRFYSKDNNLHKSDDMKLLRQLLSKVTNIIT